jgi:hypothetical protein
VVSCTYFSNPEEGECKEMIEQIKKTNFAQGLYQAFKENKIDMLVKKYGGR